MTAYPNHTAQVETAASVAARSRSPHARAGVAQRVVHRVRQRAIRTGFPVLAAQPARAGQDLLPTTVYRQRSTGTNDQVTLASPVDHTDLQRGSGRNGAHGHREHDGDRARENIARERRHIRGSGRSTARIEGATRTIERQGGAHKRLAHDTYRCHEPADPMCVRTGAARGCCAPLRTPCRRPRPACAPGDGPDPSPGHLRRVVRRERKASLLAGPQEPSGTVGRGSQPCKGRSVSGGARQRW